MGTGGGTAPVITTQPVGRLAAVETGVTFSVVATGSAGLTYQWKKDGGVLAESTRITGSTTASLSVANLAAADAGSYSVVVANDSLITTSSVAATVRRMERDGYAVAPWVKKMLAGGHKTFFFCMLKLPNAVFSF